jgi:iron complex outermembrane receptor protein
MSPLPLVSVVFLVLLTVGSAAQAQEAVEVGSMAISGDSEKPGTGLVTDEDTPKASSAATKAQFDRLRASVNPFQVTALLPSLNSSGWDSVDLLSHKLQVAPELQVFSSLSKKFKLPVNSEAFNSGNGVPMATGPGTAFAWSPLRSKQETAIALDMGALYKSSFFKASATAFLVKFKDRIASSFEPATGTAHNVNGSNPTIRGVEVEAGTLPFSGFSAYASASYVQGYSVDSLPGLGQPLTGFGRAGQVAAQFPASGLLFPDTPKSTASMSVQYVKGPWLLNLGGKYAGRRTITVVGEQSLAGFTTFDLNVALQLPSDRFFKRPTLRLDVGNLTDRRFLLSPYAGAPRFTSITLQSDF